MQTAGRNWHTLLLLALACAGLTWIFTPALGTSAQSLREAANGLQALIIGQSARPGFAIDSGLSEEALLTLTAFETTATTPVSLTTIACDNKDAVDLARPVERRL
jgi:hypothetical protein